MDTEPLRYPIASSNGRWALLGLAAALLGIVVGVRYAARFYPSVLAIGPATLVFLSTVLFAGYLSLVVASDDPIAPSVSASSILRTGVIGAVLGGVLLALPVLVLQATVLMTTPAGVVDVDTPPTRFLLGTTVAFLLFGVASYVLPVVTAAVATTSTGRLRLTASVIGDGGYLRWWTFGFPLMIVAVGLTALTATSGGLVGIAAVFGAAYAWLAGTRAFGRGFTGAIATGTD